VAGADAGLDRSAAQQQLGGVGATGEAGLQQKDMRLHAIGCKREMGARAGPRRMAATLVTGRWEAWYLQHVLAGWKRACGEYVTSLPAAVPLPRTATGV
jgi:hypothetical protein